MNRSAHAVPVRFALPAIALALSACADQATAPVTRAIAPTSLSASKASASSRADGSYIVMANGDNFATDFTARVESLGGKVRSLHNGSGLAVVTGLNSLAAQSLSTTPGIAEVDADDIVSLAQPMRAPVDATSKIQASSTRIDPTAAVLFSWQWNMRDINAPAAWAAGKVGAKGVTVAILDTGIDYDGLDMDGLVDMKRSISLSALDDSLTAADFPDRNSITDYNGHGTNVASQVSSNAVGFAGVSAKTTLMAVKVLGYNGSGFTSDVLNGILYAADNGADVANMSLGSSFARSGNHRFINVIKRVMDYAQRKGMLVVVAAGNAATDLDHNGDEFDAYCDIHNVMCVSAIGPVLPTGPDLFAFYSNFGHSVDIAAPGGNRGNVFANWPWTNFFAPGVLGPDNTSWIWNICSKTLIAGFDASGAPKLACPGDGFIDGYAGTSQATPHVSGLAALLVAQYGKNNPQLIRALIEGSADDLGKRGRDPQFGFGRINVARALGVRPLAH
jgi:subtilisin family serine protease